MYISRGFLISLKKRNKMEEYNEAKETEEPITSDALSINGTHIIAHINVLKFTDADTGQRVWYVPSLDISGYGENDGKAVEMAKFSIKEYFSYLNSLSAENKEAELLSMGWQLDKLKTKEFSKAFVDGENELLKFNAVQGEVEHLTLEAA